MTGQRDEANDWALRPWLAGGLLALCGLAVWLLTEDRETSPWRMAWAAFFFFGGLAAVFTVDRTRWRGAAVFTVAAASVMAGLAFHALDAQDHVAGEEFAFAAGVFALLLALPLFQAGFYRTRFATPYRDTHFHVWTDAVSGAGALAFTGLSWIVLAILSELFRLLKIDLLHDLMDEGWFRWTFSAAAFGAALGTLRNQMRIIGTLRHVVMLVLALLAVPTAVALAVFLGAMIVSGPEVLWDATRRATPVLLSAAAGAFVLTNAIVREDDSDMSANPAMRVAALVLAMVILPLTAFAAISMGTRIAQHGLSPARIWGLIAIVVACAYGLGAFVAVLRGRFSGWPQQLRAANLNLAAGISVLALILALPLWDFGAISTRDQLARLRSGAVGAEDFDYRALRWDFGDAGRKGLAALAERGGEIGRRAKEAQAETARYPLPVFPQTDRAAMRYQIADPAVRDLARRKLEMQPWLCGDPCFVLDAGPAAGGGLRVIYVSPDRFHFDVLVPGRPANAPEVAPAAPALPPMTAQSRVEIREWTGRRVFIDGRPAGEPFE